MKKAIFALMIVVAFASCNNTTTTTPSTDSTSKVVDSVKVDSVKTAK